MRIGRRHLGAAVAGLALAGIVAASWASGRAGGLPAGSFRVAVREVLQGDRAVVVQVEIEARAGAHVRFTSGGGGGGGCGASMPSPAASPRPWWLRRWPLSLVDPGPGRVPARPVSRMQLILLADHVGPRYKLQAALAGASSRSGFTTEGPLPEGEPLAGLVSIGVAPGTYREEEPVPVMTFDGRAFRLEVAPGMF